MPISSWRAVFLFGPILALPFSIEAQMLRPSIGAAASTPVLAREWLATPTPPPSARWIRWGLVGSAAGAVTFPLLASMSSDQSGHPARAAAAGAVGGFVVIGGAVALWDAVCHGDTRSRRAGLCGRR